jgi:hypothetical protein
MGVIMFPKYKGKLFGDEDLKTTENRRLGPEKRHHAPREFEKRLGHDLASHAPRAMHFPYSHAPMGFVMHPMHAKHGTQLSFPASALGKARTFSLNPGRNSHYKYQPSSFRISRSELWQFKRKASLELQESFYLLLDFLGYVFFFSNLFLVTMCN